MNKFVIGPYFVGEIMLQPCSNYERTGIQPPNSSINRTADLRPKEVINITDGKRLGYVKDVEFSLETGRIVSLILPGRWSFLRLFGRIEEMVIPWKDIKKIGEDIILVDIKDCH
jgi:YlmC/YmxH family sporulation protein